MMVTKIGYVKNCNECPESVSCLEQIYKCPAIENILKDLDVVSDEGISSSKNKYSEDNIHLNGCQKVFLERGTSIFLDYYRVKRESINPANNITFSLTIHGPDEELVSAKISSYLERNNALPDEFGMMQRDSLKNLL